MTQGSVTGDAASQTTRRRSGSALLERYSSAGIPVAWVLSIVVFGILEPSTFLTLPNLGNVLGSQATLVIVALGLLIPMTGGDFDLSVGGIVSMSAMVVSILNINYGVNIEVAATVAVLVGVVVGMVNGGLVVGIGLDPFIATLGTTTILSGLVFFISNDQTLSGVDGQLVAASTTPFLHVPLEFYVAMLLTLGVWYLTDWTPYGRRLLAVGRGRVVAELNGIRVGRVRRFAFVGSGMLCGIAGVFFAGALGGATPTTGQDLLLPAFAAVFLGATTVARGRYNPWGTVAAVYFLVTGITGLELLGAQTYVQNIFYGVALVVAVSAGFFSQKRLRIS